MSLAVYLTVPLALLTRLQKEIRLLETLTDMQLANEIMKSASVQKHKDLHVLDARYEGLGMKEMSPLNRASTEFTQISYYLNNSVGGTHQIRYTVQDVFRIERNGEFDRLDNSPYAKLGSKSDRRLLWHGSRASNFGGILSQGLRIAPPEAPVSGYMFGKGVYLADMSSKSAGYCAASVSGGAGILLLCEPSWVRQCLNCSTPITTLATTAKLTIGWQPWVKVKLHRKPGKMLLVFTQISRGSRCQTSSASLQPRPMCRGRTSCESEFSTMPSLLIHLYRYNEYIVYDVAQIKLRYLLQVTMN